MRSVTLFAIGIVFAFVIGCSSGNDNEDSSDPSSTVTAVQYGTPSPPPNPILTDDGIEVTLEATTDPGWPQVETTCKADGYVAVKDGGVVSIEGGPSGFKPDPGEAVYGLDGEPFVDATLVTQPAYRAEDGRLIVSWRECETLSADSLECENDGRVWVEKSVVSEVVKQPSGASARIGETVYGPDGLPLPSVPLTLIPVFRGADGSLVYGWLKCEEASPG